MVSAGCFKLLAIVLVATIMSVSADISKFTGEWKILEAYDSVDSTIPRELPTSVGHSLVFKVTLSDNNPSDTLNLGCKVGNSLRTSVKITAEQDNSASVEVGPIMSTMMMPPEDQYEFEMYLNGALPKMTTMTLGNDGQELLMTGEAKVVLQFVDTSVV
ncbi:metA domain containing protein [Nitzschia inconspicua]|uniref:MetA domain containing protein n=1 Tax=Nitzschia inconspicua TaxID=303405 RepID=A0A9K3PU55_9STRA|nr:metA domain containing protein [Nitzschia inconspicua]